MPYDFASAMRRAVQSVRARDLTGATQIIQDALAGRGSAPAPHDPPTVAEPHPTGPVIDQDGNPVDPAAGEPHAAASSASPDRPSSSDRLRKPLHEAIRILREVRPPGRTSLRGRASPSLVIPDGAQFLNRLFSCPAGSRDYKVYIPSGARTQVRGLIVMLHGCKQNPDDFARGTNMNAIADAYNVVVAYPGQSDIANALSCWNWFNPADQARGAGEPAILAGITTELMREFRIDHQRVFVAGLSAGAAMAVVLGETYPDLFAGVAAHSGLPYRVANDVVSAFAAMRGERSPPATSGSSVGSPARLIVFQGSADQTVHAGNADQIVAAARISHRNLKTAKSTGKEGGRSYSKTIFTAADGNVAIEYWLIAGAGHAWFGGQPGGSYTDPFGPHASREIMRFFLSS